MTKPRRHALIAFCAVAGGVASEWLLGRLLAQRDVLASLVAHLDVPSLALLLVALALRLFLVLIAPAWLLYVAVGLILAARRKKVPP